MRFTQTQSGCDSDLSALEGQAAGYGRRYRQAVPTFEWGNDSMQSTRTSDFGVSNSR